MKYWAFLSYSHTDSRWGDWLHKSLETYRVPRRLIGRESPDGKIPARLFPIFRDREELSVSADLTTKINEALTESRYLIIICSPRSARSRWVGEEIKAFKKLGRENRILAFIIDGEPNASEGKLGFTADDECFHEALRYRIGRDGEFSQRTEPVAGDAREGRDGKTNAKLKLLAGLLSVNYDELKQREQERRLGRARRVIAIAVLFLVAFAGLSIALFLKQREARAQQLAAETARRQAAAQQLEAENARDEANRRRDEARANLSRSDFLRALRSIEEGKGIDGLSRLVRSLRLNRHNTASACRLGTLMLYNRFALPVSRAKLADDLLWIEVPWCGQFSLDGKRIVTASVHNAARVWDTETGRAVAPPLAHAGMIHYAQFSTDGTKVVTASADGTARVWEAVSGTSLGPPLVHEGQVVSAEFSPDAKRIVTTSFDKSARIWDPYQGKELVKLGDYSAEGLYAQFSPDGIRIAVASGDHTARVWSAITGRSLTPSMKHDGQVSVVRFSSDGKYLATASVDKTARVWDSRTGRPVTEPLRHSSAVTDVAFSPSSARVATSSPDRTARVWTLTDPKALVALLKHEDWVRSVQFSLDGRFVVTSSMDRTAMIWDARSGRRIAQLIHNSPVYLARLSQDAKQIITATTENELWTWDIRASEAVPEWFAHRGAISAAKLSPNGKRLVTASLDKTARIWDVETESPTTAPLLHTSAVMDVDFSPDGTRVVTASSDRIARVWSTETGRILFDLKHDEPVRSAQFSPDGRCIATFTSGKVGHIWDAETGRPFLDKDGNAKIGAWIQFSSNGQRILTVSEAGADVWDARSGARMASIKGRFSAAELSSDGERVLTSTMDGAQVWNVASGASLGQPMNHDLIDLAHFSADGRRVLTKSWVGQNVRIWDPETGKMTTQELKHEKEVTDAQFSPDSSRITTSSLDKTASVWDVETGMLLSPPFRHAEPVNSSQFSPDGQRLLTVAGGRAFVWDIAPWSEDCPDWMLDLADLVAGEYLNDRDVIESALQNRLERIKAVAAQLDHEPAETSWPAFARWFLADRSNRTISPFCKITIHQHIEKCIAENTIESLAEAAQLAFGDPDVLSRITSARAVLTKSKEKH